MTLTLTASHTFSHARAGSSRSRLRRWTGNAAVSRAASGCLIALLLLPLVATPAAAGQGAAEASKAETPAADPARVAGLRPDEQRLTEDVARAVLRAKHGAADERPAPLRKLQERVRGLRERVTNLRDAELALYLERRRLPTRSGGPSPEELSARRDAAEQALRQALGRISERKDEWGQQRGAVSAVHRGGFRPRLLAKLGALEGELEDALAESSLTRVDRLHQLEKRLAPRATSKPRASALPRLGDETPTIEIVNRRPRSSQP